jgi:hypothetical protein
MALDRECLGLRTPLYLFTWASPAFPAPVFPQQILLKHHLPHHVLPESVFPGASLPISWTSPESWRWFARSWPFGRQAAEVRAAPWHALQPAIRSAPAALARRPLRPAIFDSDRSQNRHPACASPAPFTSPPASVSQATSKGNRKPQAGQRFSSAACSNQHSGSRRPREPYAGIAYKDRIQGSAFGVSPYRR